ncbi:MAG: hypothetical protein QN152_05920 [Armatimonadota bacterium]|nr:hypothetical protein [Armatimonadota bacterium]MDR7428406.1 hypothetical protein [Armatimonadota bacterium]MDR7469909.1 hypothetical protein [Armatimonadota bacterium]MDR7474594.1 hypothetical protein [Armatimonadota bacterium]MDR7539057.1 hypothetical protein [Armatimonadota bacterium]
MSERSVQEAISRLTRLERLVDAYAHLLTASELDRSLPALVPLLSSGGGAEAGGALKEMLQRGPSGLLAELEDLERIARAAKDPQVYAALNRVREACLYVARYNAAALLRRLDQQGRAGPAATLYREVQAFVQEATRQAPLGGADVVEVFAEEDLPGPGPSLAVPSPPAKAEAARPWMDETVDEVPLRQWPSGDVWAGGEGGPGFPPGEAGADARGVGGGARRESSAGEALDWVRERVEVLNDMLQRWAAGESLDAESSPLVRRGRLSASRCRELYDELLQTGAITAVTRLAALRMADDDVGDEVRLLRGRIVDGAVTAVPRLLGVLAAAGRLDTRAGGTEVDPSDVLADLVEYLALAADLYESGSSLRDRLLYLAAELRAALPRRASPPRKAEA